MWCRGQDSTMYYWVLMWVHFNDVCVLCQDRIENDAFIMSLNSGEARHNGRWCDAATSTLYNYICKAIL